MVQTKKTKINLYIVEPVVAIAPRAFSFVIIYTIYMVDNRRYCSVDLEFTGFDPAIDQILEIGFAFFELGPDGFVVTEEWSQVFKPSIEVHPKILGLTGITQEELDNAPEFNEHREVLQEKLGDAIIVGHNPTMDVKFLESYGIKLSGQIVDTLELVQFILPTHHSYNLENLVHYFGVKHHKAHRALGDALSTIQVLENLIRVYQKFPEKLQSELQEVINRSEFLWQKLVDAKLPEKQLEQNDSLAHNNARQKLQPFNINNELIIIDDDGNDHEARVALGLKKSNTPSVLAVSDSITAMRLWRAGFAHGIFLSEDTFSEVAFKKFLERAQTQEELRFCLKIIVWLHTNWQTEVVFDLNISFFGGQFRQFIVGGKARTTNENVIVLDYVTLQSLALTGKFKDRKLVICDILNFEKYISSGFGTRLAWGQVLYALRLVYNPETEFGILELKDKVIDALVATDLFFGLVFMLTHQSLPNNQYANLHDLANNHSQVYSRLSQAATNLKDKLVDIADHTKSGELGRVVNFLTDFFEENPGHVKWITIDEYNSTFHDQPIDISESVTDITSHFAQLQFTESITDKALLSYLVDRLGLHNEESEITNKTLPKNLHIEVVNSEPSDEELFNLSANSALPLVMVMQQPSNVKEFYNAHYSEIKKTASLFAQGYSGGGNKMFRNFSIRENSILLVTADFMAKQNYLITAKNLVFIGLPNIETQHPYTAALLQHWKKQHPHLEEVMQLQKMVGALKKLKLDGQTNVQIYTNDKNFSFWG